ncbi:unnamed protein product [Lepeophtheirus salmonis]|uniref:(salmon louse) hypothetical protein n=2 Tax=Lepeophtheirus salmonis TaxID=72036 RepID=A0A7R8H3T0_LEPSM|nr:unnamed protein product [Lepeophtheirus salmonis]CAF2847312.1 unnamed protein product [Lepeophtheirus salmonis]
MNVSIVVQKDTIKEVDVVDITSDKDNIQISIRGSLGTLTENFDYNKETKSTNITHELEKEEGTEYEIIVPSPQKNNELIDSSKFEFEETLVSVEDSFISINEQTIEFSESEPIDLKFNNDYLKDHNVEIIEEEEIENLPGGESLVTFEIKETIISSEGEINVSEYTTYEVLDKNDDNSHIECELLSKFPDSITSTLSDTDIEKLKEETKEDELLIKETFYENRDSKNLSISTVEENTPFDLEYEITEGESQIAVDSEDGNEENF